MIVVRKEPVEPHITYWCKRNRHNECPEELHHVCECQCHKTRGGGEQ